MNDRPEGRRGSRMRGVVTFLAIGLGCQLLQFLAWKATYDLAGAIHTEQSSDDWLSAVIILTHLRLE